MNSTVKLIQKVTKPYIHESIAALALDALVGLIVYVLSAVLTHQPVWPLFLAVPTFVITALLDLLLLLKCLLDRKHEVVLDAVGTISYRDCDIVFSNKWRLKGQPESLLTVWYYPKDWDMRRFKFIMETLDGKRIKPRSVESCGHGQSDFLTNICGMQRKYGDQLKFRVKYCKYSKALLSIEVISYPSDMKRRTKDYIDSGLRDILRWMIKV